MPPHASPLSYLGSKRTVPEPAFAEGESTMSKKRSLSPGVLSTALCGVFVLFGCTEEFKTCEDTATCGTGGTGAASGGAAGMAGDTAGSGGDAGGSGGAAGSGGDAGGGGDDPGGSAGMGGMAGGAGAGPEEPIVDGPCSDNGALACQGDAQKLTLICRSGTWEPNGTCSAEENCDGRTGTCSPIREECDGRAPGDRFCEEDTLIECGQDLVTITSTDCEGRCVDADGGVECAAPICSDGKQQADEQCDDGNSVSLDGCSAECEAEVVALATAAYSTCALGGNGRVKCWGYNGVGTLGLGDTDNRGDDPDELGAALDPVELGTGRRAQAIAAGWYHVCAILDDGSVKCWGDNSSGQLGLGDKDARGVRPNQMGDDLDAVDLGPGRTARAIAAGGNHTCAILDDYTVKCWGDNEYGQLGIGDTEDRGDEKGEMGDELPVVSFGVRYAKALSLGGDHSCALLDDDSLRCWGDNQYAVLGVNTSDKIGDEMGEAPAAVNLGVGRSAALLSASMGSSDGPFLRSIFTCAILDDASLKCWGDLTWLQLGVDYIDQGGSNTLPPAQVSLPDFGAGRTPISVASGGHHVCALLDGGAVTCSTSYNNFGQAGPEPSSPEALRPLIEFGTGHKAVSLHAGGFHNCVLLDDRSVKCWGGNMQGQLGVGDTLSRGGEAAHLGDALPAVKLTF